MKQQNNLWDTLVSLENIEEAHRKASKGKSFYKEVKWVNENKALAFRYIRFILNTKRFKTANYVREVKEKGGKTRVIHKLPYFPDRIVQHCLVNVCRDVWKRRMIRDTFQSIPGRGTTDCMRRVRKKMAEYKPKYAIKIDIRQFYPSVDSQLLVDNNTMRVRDKRAKWLLNDILLSLPFLPLGNHTSQYAGNLLLNKLDWFIKQELETKLYFRYCDDLVLMGDDRKVLIDKFYIIKKELENLKLEVKPYEIINLDESYLSFVGYRFSNNKILLRGNIAKNLKDNTNEESVPAYYGWCKHANAHKFYHTNKDAA